MAGKKQTKRIPANNGLKLQRDGRNAKTSCGGKNGRSRRILLEGQLNSNGEDDITLHDLHDELIGLKPHRKTNKRAKCDRPRPLRRSAQSYKFIKR
ncbi:MAG TPA: hypothetical protein VN397_02570, partial [Candidatus Methylomirabilis sp.]|nr:hypothetical protein [Candidatus Methylomirabilis sp.]